LLDRSTQIGRYGKSALSAAQLLGYANFPRD